MISLSGKVIKGQQYGRVLGFPTANLDRRQYVREKMKVKLGVWAGWAEIISNFPPSPRLRRTSKVQGSRAHKAAIVIGPLDRHRLPKIEAHLIGFKGNLYGKKITLHLEKYLRPFKKFKSEQELKKQIKKDIIKTKGVLT